MGNWFEKRRKASQSAKSRNSLGGVRMRRREVVDKERGIKIRSGWYKLKRSLKRYNFGFAGPNEEPPMERGKK